MANVREMRIFSADQIVVPPDLPNILKEYSKEVIREDPKDLIEFSKDYFEMKAAELKEAEAAAAAKKPDESSTVKS